MGEHAGPVMGIIEVARDVPKRLMAIARPADWRGAAMAIVVIEWSRPAR
jgi:hypothetical protein